MIFSSAARRRLTWRIGRTLYRRARGEVLNNMKTNGETYVQSCAVRATGRTPDAALTVFDIGANLGEWTKALLQELPSERISSSRISMFEPVPTTRANLKNNISAMQNGHIATIYPYAMSDQAGQAEMVVMSETGGTNSLEFDNKMANEALGRVEIKKTTLDIFCQDEGIKHIHLLKCDTEGHDAHALLGAKKMLQQGRIDVAQFEYNHRWIYARSYLKDMFDLIDGLPYRIGRVCPHHIEMFEAWHFELERYFEGNYLIIREPALAWFDLVEGRFDVSNTYA